MATKVLSNEFMQNMTMEEAWKELSREYHWSESLLEKFQNKVNWDGISENRNICWTIPMIQKFQKMINWDLFSKNVTKDTLTIAVLETFKDKDGREMSVLEPKKKKKNKKLRKIAEIAKCNKKIHDFDNVGNDPEAYLDSLPWLNRNITCIC
jgi:hypothetical protein